MAEDTKIGTIVDVEIPFLEAKASWLVKTPPVYSEPWTPTAKEWEKLKGKVSRCDECNVWHPLPFFNIDYLKQFVGLVKRPERPLPTVAYIGFGLGPLKKFDKPW